MEAREVDVGDTVRITRGDWMGQRGVVQTKFDLLPDSISPPKFLLTIRLEGFQRAIQKNNLDVEKISGE